MVDVRRSSAEPPRRVAVGLGAPEQERVLLAELEGLAELEIVERCITADQLLDRIARGGVDVALVTLGLHRLSRGRLEEIRAAGIDLVVLTPRPEEEYWRTLGASVLPLDARPDAVRAALTDPAQAARPAGQETAPEPRPRAEPDAPAEDADLAPVIVVASGAGSPGRTTVALGLAASLGAVAPTVIVDADASGPSVAASLDLNTLHNLYMLANARPGTDAEWDSALEEELQPIHERCPDGYALCGLPRPGVRGEVSSGFLSLVLEQLRRRYRYVIVDVGAELLSPDLGLHRAAFRDAAHVLLVATPDIRGLANARAGLQMLDAQLGIPSETVALVVNAHEKRRHNKRSEIEWALGRPAAAVIPYDRSAAERALAAQRPLVLERKSAAARALLDLAGRVHGGEIVLPPEEGAGSRWDRIRRRFRRSADSREAEGRPVVQLNEEAADGGNTVHAR